MARYDKYDPISGGFRAPLDFDIPKADVGKVFGVGLNASGRVVKGSGNTGVVGALCASSAMVARDIADVMTDGEIVDCEDLDAGTSYFSAADGTVSDSNTGTRLGQTVEAQRLVVRAAR